MAWDEDLLPILEVRLAETKQTGGGGLGVRGDCSGGNWEQSPVGGRWGFFRAECRSFAGDMHCNSALLFLTCDTFQNPPLFPGDHFQKFESAFGLGEMSNFRM